MVNVRQKHQNHPLIMEYPTGLIDHHRVSPGLPLVEDYYICVLIIPSAAVLPLFIRITKSSGN